MSVPKIGPIAFVLDGRLSRERHQILNRMITALKRIADVEVINSDLTEEEVLVLLQGKRYQLVLAPWYRYMAWSKVEAFYGLTRTSGPTFAGYISETIQPYELGEPRDSLRTIFIDFAQLSLHESLVMIQALAVEHTRSGIRPLLESETPVFWDTWNSGQSIGPKLDAVLSLPEFSDPQGFWRKRLNAIRTSFCAFWSLIYEEGPGKTDLSSVSALRAPRALFHIGVDKRGVMMKLLYSFPSAAPKGLMQQFWPHAKHSVFSPAQLLIRHTDFVRVHSTSENSEIEITVGFLPSAPSETTPNGARSLWIEPLSNRLIAERDGRGAKPLGVVAGETSTPAPAKDALASLAQNRFVQDAAQKIRELKNLITNREELITELRSGGVGTASPLPPPDPETLLEAFQERYFETRHQIRQFEVEIQLMERKGATPQEVEVLRLKMKQLTERENMWIKKITSTLEIYREAKKKGPQTP